MIKISANFGRVSVDTSGPSALVAAESIEMAHVLADIYCECTGHNIARFIQQILETRKSFITNKNVRENESDEKVKSLENIKKDFVRSLEEIESEHKGNKLAEAISRSFRKSIESEVLSILDEEIEKMKEGESE